MPNLKDVVAFCDQRTRRAAFEDFPGAVNGLQVASDGRVTKIGAAVDAGLVPFEKAVECGVDFLIVHHGLFWGGVQPLVGSVYERYACLVRGNCAVYSSHLPLDAHPEIGNNVLIARQLGLRPRKSFLEHGGEPTGWIAPNRFKRSQLLARLEELYPRVVAIECGSAQPRHVAFCSGSGNNAVNQLVGAGVDTLVTGELREEWFNYAQEHHLNLICCGHYATEVHGVRALATEVAKKFRLPCVFIETDNPL
ncbi:MAG TPA: Nif3-like dinuclear metal center hexameric protein [Candidatus Didemnitutus sp.]|nr:Nif3-like dinuclear metal center hexameric protein [Candidatus Didemnitutus sp.]